MLVVGVGAYAVLVPLLRVSGKRALSKMNAFDLVVTVALGLTLATVLLSKDVALVEGTVAFALLIFLQMAITWLSVRSPRLRKLVKAEPTLLFHRGDALTGAMRRERITPEEIEAAVRANGHASLGQVEAVVLETDGSMTVIERAGEDSRSALENVAGFPNNPVV